MAQQIFVGVMIAVLSAAALAWLGLSEDSPVSQTRPSPTPTEDPNPPSPTGTPTPLPPETPSPEAEVTVDLAKLFEDWNRNSLQVRDYYNGVEARVEGFVLTDSVYPCQVYSEQTRCIKFASSPDYGWYYQTLVFDLKDVEQAEEINRLLFRTKRPLSMTVQGTLSFDESNSFIIKDWRIIQYQPYEG